jgi:hypothetical protein
MGAFGIALIWLAACAGSPMLQDVEIDARELPKDLATRFEIREAESGASAVATKAKSKKSSAKGAGKEVYQIPNRRPAKDPLWPGEVAVYEVTYFGVSAGNFTIRVLPFKEINGRKVYHVSAEARTSKIFSLFYEIDDHLESFIDYEGLFSHRFHLVLKETKQKRDALELYDSEKKETFYWNRWDHVERGYVETKETTPMERFPQDSFSSLFYLRTLDLSDGKVYTWPVVSEGKGSEIVATVVRRERMDMPKVGPVPAVVVAPQTKFRGVLKQEQDSFIWMTDDDRHHVLRLEAKVKVGTIVATLKSLEPGVAP